MNPPTTQQGRELEGTTACVTGGAGFIGSHLVEALLARGARVTVIDDLTSGTLDNLPLSDDRLSVHEGSILDRGQVLSAIRGCSVVFHHAALVSVPESLERPDEYRMVNVEGTRSVLEACVSSGVSRLVYAGSCSAYGNLEGLPKTESDPVDPTSPYAATKLEGELLVEQFSGSGSLDTVRLRYFNIFGPRQAHDSAYAAVVPKFVEAFESGSIPLVFGDGGQTRDFIHVLDVVQANLLAATCRGPLAGRVINVGSGSRLSIMQVLEAVANAMHRKAEAEHRPAREGEVRDSEACIDLARELLGFVPARRLADSVQEIRAAARA